MARIIYALSGQGRGHTSRVIAISDALRERDHDVVFCCGGTARSILLNRGEHVIDVPALRQVLQANRICLTSTVLRNWRTVLGAPRIIRELADSFRRYAPDLLITDFEAFSPRAARRIGVPVLSLNHQQVVTEAQYDLPARDWPAAMLASTVIRFIAPRHPEHIVLTSFFFPPLKRPERTSYVPPIIRSAVQGLEPTRGEHVLVYYNEPAGVEALLSALQHVDDIPFILYNFDPPAHPERYPNLTFKQPSMEGFLEDLRTSRAVICTAGFTLISEALYLNKPLLVVPNRGIFEQTLNARFLEREDLGQAIVNRAPSHEDIEQFLARSHYYEERLRNYEVFGNDKAVHYIERLISAQEPLVPAGRVSDEPAPVVSPHSGAST